MNFSGHETFPFRYNWLTKGYARIRGNSNALGDLDGTMRELGLGKNMARSLRHWLLATGMCEMRDPPRGRQLAPTPIAQFLLDEHGGADPYLEDPGTLWLVHWLLCTHRVRATTWFVAFSLMRDREFNKADLAAAVSLFALEHGSDIATGTIERDVDCFIQCYVPAEARGEVPDDSLVCPLTELSLIVRVTSGRAESFAFSRGPQHSLADPLFTYFVGAYWRNSHPQAMSLSFDQLAYGPGSPGMVLRLDEQSLASRLDRLEELTSGALRFTEGAGVRQLARVGDLPADAQLRVYYGRRVAG